MTDERNKLLDMPGISIFDNVDYAMEEAEFLSNTTHKDHAIVGVPNQDGSIDQYVVMERSRAITTCAVILETFLAMEKQTLPGVH
jgi:hypothetical protein